MIGPLPIFEIAAFVAGRAERIVSPWGGICRDLHQWTAKVRDQHIAGLKEELVELPPAMLHGQILVRPSAQEDPGVNYLLPEMVDDAQPLAAIEIHHRRPTLRDLTFIEDRAPHRRGLKT